MRPNTVHMVVTLENSICHGGHFYAMSTMRDSCFGLYGCFFYNSKLTNTDHVRSRAMLRRMVCYCAQVYCSDAYWEPGE